MVTSSRKLCASLLLQCWVAFCTLGVVELGVRILHLAPDVYRLRTGVQKSAYEHSENPRLGYVLKQGYRDTAGPDLHESFPATNSHGQRDIERSIERRPGVFRILMLGDSVVAGHGIEAVEDTLPLQLQRLQTSPGVEVLNFGVGGYCTTGEVELLRVKGLKYRPDLVILVFVSNDYVPLNTQVSSYTYERPQYVDALFQHSSLFRYLSLRTNFLHFREQLDPSYWRDQNSSQLSRVGLLESFAELKQLSDSERFNVVTVLWPTFSETEVHDRLHPAAADSTEPLVETITRGLGMRSLRLSPAFLQDHAARCAEARARELPCPIPKDLYTIGDEMHPSELGAAVAARALLPLVQEYLAH